MSKSVADQSTRKIHFKNAQDVLLEYWKHYPKCLPINVVAIANNEGISVFKASFQDAYSNSVLGFIRKANEKTEIYVNSMDSKTRQRFTIAHELGHYFLHHNGDLQYVDLRSGKTTPAEVSANRFASELLMPSELVQREYNKLMFPTVSEMASIFEVSPAAMRIRLATLNLEAY